MASPTSFAQPPARRQQCRQCSCRCHSRRGRNSRWSFSPRSFLPYSLVMLLLPMLLMMLLVRRGDGGGSGSIAPQRRRLQSPRLPDSYFDDLLASKSKRKTLSGNVHNVVVDSSDGDGNGDDDEERDHDEVGSSARPSHRRRSYYAVCHLVNYLALSRAGGEYRCGDDASHEGKIYRELAAIMMAVRHFNGGDGSVVREVEGLDRRCPVRLTAEFHDSGFTPTRVVRSLTTALAERRPPPTGHAADDPPPPAPEEGQQQQQQQQTPPWHLPYPCAVLGPRTSSSTRPAATVSGVYDLPHVSAWATSPELSDNFQYPLFQRVVPSNEASAKAAVRFFNDVMMSTNIAVLYVNDPYGNEYNKAVLREATAFGIDVESFPLVFPPSEPDILDALRKVKASDVRHVFLIAFTTYIEKIMLTALDVGITGPDYFYLLGISTHFFDAASYEPNQAKAFEGMGILPDFGARPTSEGYRRFVEAWNGIENDDGGGGNSTLRYLNSKLPPLDDGSPHCFRAEPGFFSERHRDDPGGSAHFAYDAVIATGLAACRALVTDGDGKNATTTAAAAAATERSGEGSGYYYLGGREHADAIVQGTRFEGASGLVALDGETRSRDPLRFTYAVMNVVASSPSSESGENVTFRAPESFIIRPTSSLDDWEIVEREGDQFVFAGGRSAPPGSLPELRVDRHQIGHLSILGYVLCAAVTALSVGFGIWTYRNRDVPVVRSSQPDFLIMASVGALILGSVLIPLGMDDQHFEQKATDVACMSTPWLASIGFIVIFSALFSKTMRIHRLVSHGRRLSRIKVSERDVLPPFVLLMIANLTVLLCWSILDPLRYVRKPDEGTDRWNRVVSSTGRCTSSGNPGALPFTIPLALINLSAVALANFMAYRARNIHTEFSESRYIGLAMLFLLQTWLTGIPVLALSYDNPQAYYAVATMIIFLTCLVVLLLLFVPKINHTRKQQKKRRRESQGSTSSRADLSVGLKVYRQSSEVHQWQIPSRDLSCTWGSGLGAFDENQSSPGNIISPKVALSSSNGSDGKSSDVSLRAVSEAYCTDKEGLPSEVSKKEKMCETDGCAPMSDVSSTKDATDV